MKLCGEPWKKKGGGGGEGGCLPQKKCCGMGFIHGEGGGGGGGGGGGHISAKGATKGPKSRGFQRFLDNKQRVRSNQSIIAQLTVHSIYHLRLHRTVALLYATLL